MKPLAVEGRIFSALPCLYSLDVLGLQALRTFLNVKADPGTLFQAPIAVAYNGRKVHENVLAALALDESIAFRGVEPLHCSLFLHSVYESFTERFGNLWVRRGKTRRRAVRPQDPSTKLDFKVALVELLVCITTTNCDIMVAYFRPIVNRENLRGFVRRRGLITPKLVIKMQ